jgi:transcriptional regulator with XRE-family HTH domain
MNDSTSIALLDSGTGTITATIGNNIRALRKSRDVSMAELARSSDVAKGTLSQLERGLGNPTLSTILSIAKALGVTVGELLDGTEAPRSRVVRSGEGARLAEGSFSVGLLDRVQLGIGRLDIFELEMAASHRRISPGFSTGVIEHIFVRSGVLTVGLVAAPVQLRAGDYASYPGSGPHIYATGPEPAAAVCVSYYPTA